MHLAEEIMDEKLSTIPNDKYRKFFEKFKEIDSLKIEEWKKTHILAYFCKKYKLAYNIDYSFKFNNPAPSKCFEVWQVSSLCGKLSSDPQILKEYIDWCFEVIVPKAKRRLTSISFITRDETLNPYKMNLLSGIKSRPNIDRSTNLPSKYLDILANDFPAIRTYGDLSFIWNIEPLSGELLSKMNEAGFDENILKEII